MLGLALVAAAYSQVPPTPSLVDVDAGDAAYFSGRRREGVRLWREAVREADASAEGRAAVAMARLRLVHTGVTWSALVQGPKIEAALAACPAESAWCRLARVDYDLFAPFGIGHPEAVPAGARALAGELPAQAGSRLAFATHDRAALTVPTDGLGQALSGGPVFDPGPWVGGVGIKLGAPAGLGLGVHLWNRDVFRKHVLVTGDVFAAVHGAGVVGTIDPKGPAIARVQATRWPELFGSEYHMVTTARLAPGVGFGHDRHVEIGPLARWDAGDGGGLVAGHGVWAGASVVPWHGAEIRGAGEWALPPLADYRRIGGVAEIKETVGLGRSVLTGRVRGEAATPGPDVREPTVGGPNVLRGAPIGKIRGPVTAAADLEARVPVHGVLGAAVFADGAWVSGRGWHGGGGGGVRLAVVPGGDSTLRVDFAATDLGTGLYIAWGEAF